MRDADVPQGLKDALKTHERIPVFIDNLAAQLSGIKKISREQVVSAVRDLSHVFVRAVRLQADERVISPLKKAIAKAEASRKAEMDKLVDAIDTRGITNATQDKAGNETHRQEIEID